MPGHLLAADRNAAEKWSILRAWLDIELNEPAADLKGKNK